MKALKLTLGAVLVVALTLSGLVVYGMYLQSRTLAGLTAYCVEGCVLRPLPDGQWLAVKEAEACPRPKAAPQPNEWKF